MHAWNLIEVLDSTKIKKCLIEFYDFYPSYPAKSCFQVDAGPSRAR